MEGGLQQGAEMQAKAGPTGRRSGAWPHPGQTWGEGLWRVDITDVCQTIPFLLWEGTSQREMGLGEVLQSVHENLRMKE